MSEGTVEVTPRLAGMLRVPLFWACLAVLGLGAYLYYPFFLSATNQTLSVRGEEFFFEVNIECLP